MSFNLAEMLPNWHARGTRVNALPSDVCMADRRRWQFDCLLFLPLESVRLRFLCMEVAPCIYGLVFSLPDCRLNLGGWCM